MTPEHQTEWQHIFETRLGILGVPAGMRPTLEQRKIATTEADEWIVKLDFQEREERQHV